MSMSTNYSTAQRAGSLMGGQYRVSESCSAAEVQSYAMTGAAGQCCNQQAKAPDAAYPRSPHVSEEISLLQGASNSLTEAVDNLINRLGAVLAPIPVEPTGEGLDNYRVPLAEEIRRQRRIVRAQVGRIQEVLRALEL